MMTPPEDVASWDAAKFATLSTLHVKTLSPAQLTAITGAQLATLPQNRMAAFTPAQVWLMDPLSATDMARFRQSLAESQRAPRAT
jgi:hypothetical protein